MTPFPRPDYAPLEPYAPDRRPIAVDLSDNTNRWGVHPGALAAVAGASAEDFLRYPPVYADHLRAAVAERFGVPMEAVSTGCGSDDLLDSLFRATGVMGEGVRFIPPTFSMIEIFARMNGLEAMPLEREAGAGPESPFGPLPDPARLLEGGPAMVYLCRPNNPTGEVQPRRWVDAVIEAAEGAGTVVAVDEAYADFLDPRVEDPDDLLRAAAGSRRLVVLRTLSKVYGLAGLRVGYAVGSPEVIRELEKSRGPYKVNRMAEAAGVAALRDEAGWIPGILDEVRVERTRLAQELSDRGLAALPSGANFLCVPLAGAELSVDPTAAAVTAAFREREVAIRPFPALPGIGEAVRVSIGPRAEMDAFLQALDEIRG
ncbi:MAG: histidinol-phosphate aminotransferase family protein [Gemmatimonadales bacterium]|nr:MAG: histidinol-phosphate aminotransferase family protein [Gemmatimonadales bacterium]